MSIIFSTIGANLDLSGARFGSLDLTGTRIGDELRLGSGRYDTTTWREGSRLTLRNTVVEILQDRVDAWPQTLDLEGFAYDRLGGPRAEGGATIAARETGWFIDWLARDGSYSRQPYVQLASILTKEGQVEKAGDILFAANDRERQLTFDRSWSGWIWRTMFWATLGYGLRPHYAFIWLLAFLLIGALLFRRTEESQGYSMLDGLFYSLDMLIPVIQLREVHSKIDLPIPIRYYFYFIKILGYMFVFILFKVMENFVEGWLRIFD